MRVGGRGRDSVWMDKFPKSGGIYRRIIWVGEYAHSFGNVLAWAEEKVRYEM